MRRYARRMIRAPTMPSATLNGVAPVAAAQRRNAGPRSRQRSPRDDDSSGTDDTGENESAVLPTLAKLMERHDHLQSGAGGARQREAAAEGGNASIVSGGRRHPAVDRACRRPPRRRRNSVGDLERFAAAAPKASDLWHRATAGSPCTLARTSASRPQSGGARGWGFSRSIPPEP
jgi:hypothetical protein